MTNLTDILRRTIEDGNTRGQKLLWHLQSYELEDSGPARFKRELKEWFPETPDSSVTEAMSVATHGPGFAAPQKILHKALFEHFKKSEEVARKSYHLTNIGKPIWDTLDWCLEERRPCFIEGLEGRGKSASAQAWCATHRGEARYVSLPGLATQRDFFTALAQAYGVRCTHAKAPNEMRFRLRDIIVRSGLVLVMDEAHFALPERTQRGRPALIDWIDTELCNAGVAIALVTTPQFGPRLAEFENRTTWNARQFKRRFSGRWCQLEEKTSEHHLEVLAENALPDVGKKGHELATKFAAWGGRDVSGLFDLVRDAQRRARKAGRSDVTFQDLREAYTLDRIPAENAMASTFDRTGTARPAVKETQPGEEPLPLAGSRAAGIPILSTDNRRAQIESATK